MNFWTRVVGCTTITGLTINELIREEEFAGYQSKIALRTVQSKAFIIVSSARCYK